MRAEPEGQGYRGPMLVCPGCREMVPLQFVIRIEGLRSFACPACDHHEEWIVGQERVRAS